jgi:hypothetical protein
MTCPEMADRILDHVYGELPEGERSAFQAHLATCESCRRELEGMERTRRTARLALDGPLSQPAPERIRREVLLAAEAAVRQRGAVPAAAAAGAAQILGSRAGKGQASEAGPGSWWAWLRRPWFLPAFATMSLLAIFFIARPALMEGPGQVLEDRFAEKTARVPSGAPLSGPAIGVLSAPPPAPAEPEPAPSAAAAPELDQGRDEVAGGAGTTGGLKGAALRGSGPEAKEKAANAPEDRRADLAPQRSRAPLGQGVRQRAAADEEGGGRARIVGGAGDSARSDDGLARPARRSVERPKAEESATREAAARADTVSNRYAQPPPRLAVQPPAVRLLQRPQRLELQEPLAAAAAAAPAAVPADVDEAEEESARPQGSGFRFESRARKLAPARGAAGVAPGEGAQLESESLAPAPPPAPATAPAAAPRASAGAPVEMVGKAAAAAKPQPGSTEPLAVVLERADRAFAEGKWQAAADAYRELTRRFSSDPRARQWRQRLDMSLANQRRAR